MQLRYRALVADCWAPGKARTSQSSSTVDTSSSKIFPCRWPSHTSTFLPQVVVQRRRKSRFCQKFLAILHASFDRRGASQESSFLLVCSGECCSQLLEVGGPSKHQDR